MTHPTTTARPAGRLFLPGLLLLAAAAGVFFFVWRAADAGDAQARAEAAAAEVATREAAVSDFLKNDAAGLVGHTQQKDTAAVQRALDALRARFRSYAEGIGPFTGALTAWGTRAKIVYRSTVETVERKDEHSWTAAIVQEKFAQHIVSDAALERDVMEVMKQFTYELEANRNELLSVLETRVTALPVRVPALRDFRPQMQARVTELLRKLPGQSVQVGAGGIAAGIVAEEAVRQIIRAVIAQATARLAAGAAASGGAAATAAAAGGAGGTVVAPGVGTAIGIAGGVIAGAVVDWWMTAEFKAKVAAQCRSFLLSTQTALLTGDTGLEKTMLDCAAASSAAVSAALQDSLQPDRSSTPPPLP